MSKVHIDLMTELQLNYAIAKIRKHEWRCPWILAEQGHIAFFSYEAAWGNPMIYYTTNPRAALTLVKDANISVIVCNIEPKAAGRFEVSGGWVAKSPKALVYQEDGIRGATWELAVAKCFVHMHIGSEIEVDF